MEKSTDKGEATMNSCQEVKFKIPMRWEQPEKVNHFEYFGAIQSSLPRAAITRYNK